jgi:putative addiction module component (TIGR02574 family)
MSYNTAELLKLPVIERYDIALALWESIEDEELPVTSEERVIAEERYNEYLKNPNAGFTWEECRKKIQLKYGF